MGGGAELEAVWGKGYARDKERSGVCTNLCAAGVLKGSLKKKNRREFTVFTCRLETQADLVILQTKVDICERIISVVLLIQIVKI